ncbi:MAG: EamA/RhaT family transporter, partial [Myxococcales bacterium]
PLRPASSEALLYIVLAAALPQLVGHNLLTWSVRFLPPAAVGMAVVAEPVGATALAWLWLGEAAPPWVALGCALTLAGVVLAIRDGAMTVAAPDESSAPH